MLSIFYDCYVWDNVKQHGKLRDKYLKVQNTRMVADIFHRIQNKDSIFVQLSANLSEEFKFQFSFSVRT